MSGWPDARVALVCLDLQRGRLADAPSRETAERTVLACRRVLTQARARGWPVLHVHRREASPEGARPIAGLEPLPLEPIFYCSGPSAFSHRGFRQAARALGGPLALIGFSMGDSVLATAFAAADRDIPVEVVADAVAPGRDPMRALAPLARIIDSIELLREDAATPVAANTP